MKARGSGRRKIVAGAVVGCPALALVCWIVMAVMHAGSHEAVGGGGAEVSGLGAGRQPIELPVALLTDYYEHTIEHTPPRDPSGSMQRRERFYLAPEDPFVSLDERLGKDGPDGALRHKLDEWKKEWLAGQWQDQPGVRPFVMRFSSSSSSGRSGELTDLEESARQSSLKARTLMDIGRAFDFLCGDEVAAAWFRAGIGKAKDEYEKTQPGDPAAAPLLHQLEQTKALWRTGDNGTLEQRFALAMALNAPLSVESRRAGCLHATALYMQGRAGEAADAILKVWDEQKRAGDLGVLEKSDFGEMNWVTALYLYVGKRYDEAVPYYRAFLLTDDNRKRQGASLLASCLTMAGKPDDAAAVRKQYGIPLPQSRPTIQGNRVRRIIRPATEPATRPIS